MKFYQRFFLIVTISLSTIYLNAQVTIGGLADPQTGTILDLNSATKGGLLLPNINIPDLGKIPASGFVGITSEQDSDPALSGTVVYNTNPATGIGLYIWDGEDWNKLTTGGSVVLTGESTNCSIFPADGSCNNQYTTTDPACKGMGAFSFTWIAGENYIDQLTVLDAGAGKFSIKFQANDRAFDRQAILMITSPCGNSNTFVFSQAGDNSGCTTANPVPDILGENGYTICSGGAVYLYLSGRPTTGTYIWTLNGEEVARGNRYTALKAGKYIVYSDKIGCTATPPKTVQVAMSNTKAPDPVHLIVNTNNGIACGAGGSTQLVVTDPVSGTIYWYRDGVKVTGVDYDGKSTINAGAGSWQAVVEEGTCSSVLSETAIVTEDLSGNRVATPTMKVNGVTTGWTLCQGGSAYLEVENPDQSVIYTWYANNTKLGEGNGIYFPVPAKTNILLRLRATGSGCAKEVNVNVTVGATPAPPIPTVLGNSSICGGTTSLSAGTTVVNPTFQWYKNDVAMGLSTQSINVTEAGEYSVTVASGTCVSAKSMARKITLSDFSSLSWVQNPNAASFGDVKTYEVAATNGPVKYQWKITQGGTDITSSALSAGQGTNRIQVNFPPSGGDVNVEVTATNDCGAALNNAIMANNPVTLSSACPTPTIISPATPQTIRANVGTPVSLSVSASNLNTPIYQWYRNGNLITGATAASYSFTPTASGTTTYRCTVMNFCVTPPITADSPEFTVIVDPDPGTLNPGSGTLSGKPCFDIAESNDNAECGRLIARQAMKSNFASLPESDRTYTFRATGAGSNLRFVVIDSENCLEPGNQYTGNGISGDFSNGASTTIRLNFKTNLNTSTNPQIMGRTRNQAAVVKIYAVFNNQPGGNGTEVSVPITIRIQDCMCCGAYISPTEWKTFMCHNLGADESHDPFDPNLNIHGNMYQWGRPAPVANMNSNTTGAIPGWNSTPAPDDAWKDDVKTANDPCPPGWRVPTRTEWEGVNNNNTMTRIGNWGTYNTTTAVRFGSALLLPITGIRDSPDGVLVYRGLSAYYLSSTASPVPRFVYFFGIGKNFSEVTDHDSALGAPIRCISE